MGHQVFVAFAMACCLAVAPIRTGAEIYRWTDGQGKVHFGDRKPDGGKVESFRGSASVSFIGGEPGTQAEARPSIRMFTTQWCSVCKRAKAYFNKRGIPFEELDIETSRDAREQYDELGGKGVPLVLVGKRRMSGFDSDSMEALLKEAGL
jgi:glutaredoxin